MPHGARSLQEKGVHRILHASENGHSPSGSNNSLSGAKSLFFVDVYAGVYRKVQLTEKRLPILEFFKFLNIMRPNR